MFYPTSEDITAMEVRKKEGREFILKKIWISTIIQIKKKINYEKQDEYFVELTVLLIIFNL